MSSELIESTLTFLLHLADFVEFANSSLHKGISKPEVEDSSTFGEDDVCMESRRPLLRDFLAVVP